MAGKREAAGGHKRSREGGGWEGVRWGGERGYKRVGGDTVASSARALAA